VVPSFLTALDWRLAARRLRRAPAFTCASVLLLAIPIAAATLVFSVVRGLLLDSIPYADPDRLVVLSPGPPLWDLFEDLKNQDGVFDCLGAYTERAANLSERGPAERVLIGKVTSEFLAAAGVHPAVGRVFTNDEFNPPHDRVALITHRTWSGRYGGGARDVIGQTLTLDGRPYTIVGVLPPNFKTINEMRRVRDLPFEREVGALVPLVGDPHGDPSSTDKVSRPLTVLGRLRGGVSVQRANSRMSAVLAHAHMRFMSMPPFSFVSLSSEVAAGLPAQLAIVSTAVGILLFVACVNVTTLVLARIEARRRELAVCCAIGSNAMRIVGSVLSETFLISAMGGAAGVLMSWQAGIAAKKLTAGLLDLRGAPMDLRVLAVAAALVAGTGLFVGLGPALRYARIEPALVLQRSCTVSRNRDDIPFASVLVATQIAFAVVLVVVGVLLARAFERSVSPNPGFAADRILTAEISLDRAAYWRYVSTRYFADLLERVSSLPGVERAALVSTVPGGEFQGSTGVKVDGRFYMTGTATISPHYFAVLSIPILAGTSFSDQDTRSSPPVVVVNASFARKHWGTPLRALGQTIAMGQISTTTATGPFVRDLEWTVIAVVADSRDSAGGTSPEPKIYSNYTQFSTSTQMTILVQSRSDDAGALSQPLIRLAREIDPEQPLYNVLPLSEITRSRLTRRRAMAAVMNVFAGVTLLIAALGVYAAMSCMAALRRHEVGVRLALGGTRMAVLRSLAWRGAKHVLVGVELGILFAVTAVSLLRAWLLGGQQADVSTGVLAILVVIIVSAIALLAPAWRATRVDPIEILRAE